jgi:hypothetical protein
MMSVEQSMKWELVGETEVLGESLPLCRPQIPHDLGSNPVHRSGDPATNCLSYGTTFIVGTGELNTNLFRLFLSYLDCSHVFFKIVFNSISPV